MSRPGLSSGLWGVLATPFRSPDSSVDYEAVGAQVRFQRQAGAVGVVALGVFGEAAQLSGAEQVAVARAVAEAAGDFPFVLGVADLETRAAAATAESLSTATKRRAAGVMVLVNDEDPHTLSSSLTDVHLAAGVPVVVQDYPARTGMAVDPGTLAKVVGELDFVAAIKCESPPTSTAIGELSSRLEVPVFGGLGGLGLLDELWAGASGAMTGFSFPEALVAVLEAWQTRGRFAAARAALLPWLPLVNFEAQPYVGLAIRKWILQQRGVLAEPLVRPPSRSLPASMAILGQKHLESIPDVIVADSHEPRVARCGHKAESEGT